MRVWIDITGPAHVLVFRPLVEVLRERGAEVEITTREFSQNVELLRLHGMEATVVGTHGGRTALTGKERVVCLDEGFAGNDQLKTNAVQTMKARGVTSFRTV